MTPNHVLPDDPLGFIQKCVSGRKILWTYHVNMRLKGRFISLQAVVDSHLNYEIIEQYPEDKYSPSYLLGRSIRATYSTYCVLWMSKGIMFGSLRPIVQTRKNGMKVLETGGNLHEMPYVWI